MIGPSTSNGGGARGDRPDLLTAAILLAFGVLGLVLTRDLESGTLAQMSSGFMPRVVCVLLIGVAVIIGVRASRRDAVVLEAFRLRPLVVITAAIVGFAFAVTHLGFVIASLWLILVGSLAEQQGRLWSTLALALGLTIFGAVVFVYGLGVQVNLWPN